MAFRFIFVIVFILTDFTLTGCQRTPTAFASRVRRGEDAKGSTGRGKAEAKGEEEGEEKVR
jgi:hypothetical protein